MYDSAPRADAGRRAARLLTRSGSPSTTSTTTASARSRRCWPRSSPPAPRTLRLGMGVSLLPLHHPVDLAEQLAVLDVVSGGRLDVGIGRGGTLQDYQTFQSDRERQPRARRGRHRADAAVLERRSRSTSGARSTRPSGLHVRPRPVQRPHPPLFIAANSEDSVRSAARLGLPTPVLVLRADGGAAAAAPIYRERVARAPAARAPRSRRSSASRGACGWCTSAPTATRRCGSTEAPFMGYQQQDGGRCAPRPPAAPCPTRSTGSLAAPAARSASYLDDGWALDRHAGRGARGPAGVSRRHRLPARAAADGAARFRHPARASLPCGSCLDVAPVRASSA